ncbi:unnamed protein product [Caenorhabditis brenneri]
MCSVDSHDLDIYLTHCMKDFYGQVYQGNISCSVDYLSRNMTIKLEAFTSGKLCFMGFVRNNCSTRVLPYLTSNYGEFLQVLTALPAKNQSCVSLRDQLITAECSVFETRLLNKIDGFNNTKTLRAACKEMEECLNQSPYISAGNDLYNYKKRCHNEISLVSGVNFSGCLIKVGYSNFTKYDCVPPNATLPEFFENKAQPNFFEDKECARTLMFGECEGKLDNEDFEESWDILMKKRGNETATSRAEMIN